MGMGTESCGLLRPFFQVKTKHFNNQVVFLAKPACKPGQKHENEENGGNSSMKKPVGRKTPSFLRTNVTETDSFPECEYTGPLCPILAR